MATGKIISKTVRNLSFNQRFEEESCSGSKTGFRRREAPYLLSLLTISHDFNPPQWRSSLPRLTHALSHLLNGKRGLHGDLTTLKPPKPLDGLEKILRPYQAVGSSWMLHLFDHGLGGILADEMGLGKTLQTLSFLSSLKQREQYVRTSLVVCPASLIENWNAKPNGSVRLSPFMPIMAQIGRLYHLFWGSMILLLHPTAPWFVTEVF